MEELSIQEQLKLRDRALTVKCPKCLAEAGKRCRYSTGDEVETAVHTARIEALTQESK